MRMAAEGAGIVYIVITFPAEYMFKDRLEGRLSNSVEPRWDHSAGNGPAGERQGNAHRALGPGGPGCPP